MKNIIIFYWYIFDFPKYERYQALIQNALYTEDEAFDRIFNQD